MVRIVWSKIEWIQELQATGIYRRGVYYVIGNENSRKRTLTLRSAISDDHHKPILTSPPTEHRIDPHALSAVRRTC
jgi:hypothetical protein